MNDVDYESDDILNPEIGIVLWALEEYKNNIDINIYQYVDILMVKSWDTNFSFSMKLDINHEMYFYIKKVIYMKDKIIMITH